MERVRDPYAGERYLGVGRVFLLPDPPYDEACTGTLVQAVDALLGGSHRRVCLTELVTVHAGGWCPVCEWDEIRSERWAHALKPVSARQV